MKRTIFTLITLAASCYLTACAAVSKHESVANVHGDARIHGPSAGNAAEDAAMAVIDLRASTGIEAILPVLEKRELVYIGETHDRYGHHLAQLEIIRRLHAGGADLAIGMEMFQRPFQSHLDAYITGEIDEKGMLAATEWYDRWSFDYRLYRPVIAFAREHGIPVVALNVEQELRKRVSEVGVDGLDEGERQRLPAEIDRSDKEYEERLQSIFEQHAKSGMGDFTRFMEVQLLWDETMAETAARYLQANPGKRMVVIAGSGHLQHGSGIPRRLARRLQREGSIVLPGDGLQVAPGIADFLIYPQPAELPQAGLLGVFLEGSEQGVRIGSVLPDGAADRAGVKKDDIVKALDGQPLGNVSDLKIALLDRVPGEKVRLLIERERLLVGSKELELEFPLGP